MTFVKVCDSWLSHPWVKKIHSSLPTVQSKGRSSLMFWKNSKSNILLGFRAKRMSQMESPFFHSLTHLRIYFMCCCGSGAPDQMLRWKRKDLNEMGPFHGQQFPERDPAGMSHPSSPWGITGKSGWHVRIYIPSANLGPIFNLTNLNFFLWIRLSWKANVGTYRVLFMVTLQLIQCNKQSLKTILW